MSLALSGRLGASSLALVLCAALAPTQSVLTVDATGGSGAFQDIQSAVDAAQPGDHIMVLPGVYPTFSVSKPVSIVAKDGAGAQISFGQMVFVSNIPAGTDLVIRGLSCLFLSHYDVRDCQGRVLLDQISGALLPPSLEIENCAQVVLNDCEFVGSDSIAITNSIVTITGGEYQGRSNWVESSPALTIQDSVVSISRANISGGGNFLVAIAAPAIEMNRSHVTVTDDGSHSVVAGLVSLSPGQISPYPAIAGSGTLVLDPDVVLETTLFWPPTSPPVPLVSVSGSVIDQEVPSLVARAGAIGEQFSVALHSRAGESYWLIMGAPANAVALSAGSSWIDPLQAAIVASGTLGSSGAIELSFPAPPSVLLAGQPVMCLAVVDDGSGLTLSNNAGCSLGF